jgi:hypothetical protein
MNACNPSIEFHITVLSPFYTVDHVSSISHTTQLLHNQFFKEVAWANQATDISGTHPRKAETPVRILFSSIFFAHSHKGKPWWPKIGI